MALTKAWLFEGIRKPAQGAMSQPVAVREANLPDVGTRRECSQGITIAVVGRFIRWPWGQHPDESYLADGLEAAGAMVLRIDQELPYLPMPIMDWTLFTGHPGSYSRMAKWPRGSRTILWTLDWVPDFKDRAGIIRAAAKATIFLTSDEYDWRAHHGLRNHLYFPGACEGYRPSFRPRPAIPCAFLGSLYSERRRRIARLVRSLGGVVRDRIDSWLYREALAHFVQGVRVVVGDNFRNDVSGYWSTRNYIIPGAGGFLLTSHVPGLSEQFEHGTHLAIYKSLRGLQEALPYWIAEDLSRERIRREGFLHVRSKHTWAERGAALLRVLRHEMVSRRGS